MPTSASVPAEPVAPVAPVAPVGMPNVNTPVEALNATVAEDPTDNVVATGLVLIKSDASISVVILPSLTP